LGFDQGKVKPLSVEASRICEFDLDELLVPRLVRVECCDKEPLGALGRRVVDAVSFVHGINVVLALPKKLLVPWLNLSKTEGSGGRLSFERDCRVTVVRIDGCRVVVGVPDCSRPKLGIVSSGNFSFGRENELVSRTVGRLVSERLVPVART
jgi:hypothetical protein